MTASCCQGDRTTYPILIVEQWWLCLINQPKQVFNTGHFFFKYCQLSAPTSSMQQLFQKEKITILYAILIRFSHFLLDM